MTNTRITDAEVLERRYPVIVRSFCLRNESGGRGRHNGGDGISRELLFRKAMTLSVLTERRVYSPYGLEGKILGTFLDYLSLYLWNYRGGKRRQGKEYFAKIGWSYSKFRSQVFHTCRRWGIQSESKFSTLRLV